MTQFNREERPCQNGAQSTPSIDSILSDESLEKGLRVVHKTRGIDVGTGEKTYEQRVEELYSYVGEVPQRELIEKLVGEMGRFPNAAPIDTESANPHFYANAVEEFQKQDKYLMRLFAV